MIAQYDKGQNEQAVAEINVFFLFSWTKLDNQYTWQLQIYPALTGSKTPISWGWTARKSPIGSNKQDVGHSGVATRRGAFHFRSSISEWGMKKTTPDGSFTLL